MSKGTELLKSYLSKAGPYIGPRGGKWADAKHTIPWSDEKNPSTGKNDGDTKGGEDGKKEMDVHEQGRELTKKLEANLRKMFPNSVFQVAYREKTLGVAAPAVDIRFRLKKEVNVTAHNDPAYHIITINYPKNYDGSQKVQADLTHGGKIIVEKDENTPKHQALDSVKVGWRNKSGTPEQCAKHIEQYFSKLRTTLKDNAHRIKGFDAADLG